MRIWVYRVLTLKLDAKQGAGLIVLGCFGWLPAMGICPILSDIILGWSDCSHAQIFRMDCILLVSQRHVFAFFRITVRRQFVSISTSELQHESWLELLGQNFHMIVHVTPQRPLSLRKGSRDRTVLGMVLDLVPQVRPKDTNSTHRSAPNPCYLHTRSYLIRIAGSHGFPYFL